MAVGTKETRPNGAALTAGPCVTVIRQRCAGCQECIIRCPTQALSMDPVAWVAVANSGLCVGCRQCMRTCPFSAIRVEGPMVVARRTPLPASSGPVTVGDLREVRAGFSRLADAVAEAKRCLNCPDPGCVRGCPAHNDIPAFIESVRNSDLERAQQVLSQTSCLPDVCSRVCDWAKQCEGACTWALAGGEAVAIGKLERFVTDNSPFPPVRPISQQGKGLSVAVIGSGPAGIAAARELASVGASVTVYERDSAPGGVMRWGIPSYILPDKITARGIKALLDAGVEMHTGVQVTPDKLEQLLEMYDAVVAAYGTVSQSPRIPGLDLDGVIDATVFLAQAKRALADGSLLPEFKGATVLVLGGGNTAIDAARSVVRLGSKPIVIHREEERFSLARPDELAEAIHEGTEVRFATSVARFQGEAGKVRQAVLVHTRQKQREAIPASIPGSEHTLDGIDMVIVATGCRLDPSFSALFEGLPLRQPAADRVLPDRRWLASGIMDGTYSAGRLAWQREYGLRSSSLARRDRLWLVGDALIGPSSVVASMAQGRQAAQAILEMQPRRPGAGKRNPTEAATGRPAIVAKSSQ